jgi:hypothetical protein
MQMSQHVDELRLAHPELLAPRRFWRRTEILGAPCPVPRSSGVYAWYFKQIPPGVPTDNCVTADALTLLYVGISPKAPPSNPRSPSRETVQSRLRYRMDGNAEGSTLRLTLGCLLSKQLGIELRRVGSGTRLTFCDGERRLSEWLGDNAFVTWKVCCAPGLLEEQLIRHLPLPLNVDQNGHHAFHPVLTAIRKAARHGARQAPIWHPGTS